jgi:ferredoxin
MGKNNATITPKGQLTVISKSKEDAEAYFKSTLKAILRGMYCIKCGSCQYICEANAIKISDHPIVDEDKCVKCGKCQLNCPLAEYTSKIIVEGICI